MRFGKKTRNLASAGRRFFGDRTPDDAPSALAENPEPATNVDEEMDMTPPAPEESMVAGDPTQRLLTALGRFQRQVSRAEEGASQDAWCDECMHQLIAGIEIALNESWADVKEALTDTARVLQTYEDANRAADCVPFLKDSYEILCLMVGDLIVDNVRSGVMKKWHERYERALNDLAGLGLTLVDDDSTRERETHQEAVRDAGEHGLDTPDPFESGSYDAAGEGAQNTRDDGDAFDALIGDGLDDSEPRDAAADSDPFTPVSENAAPFGEPPEEMDGRNMGVLPSLDELLGDEEQASESSSDMSLTSDFTADGPFEPAGPRDGIGANPFADEETPPQEEALTEAAAVPEEDADTIPPVEAGGATPEPMELDLEADEEENASGEPVEAPVEAPPEPVAATPEVEPEPEPGSPQALLKTAQEAMASGNVAGAKLFALQLAANMARLEARQVEERADAIKAEIDANVEAVGAAERTVTDAEERVRNLEEQVTQYQQEFDGKREEVQQIRDEVAGVESTVADLDRQIAELESRREEEQVRLAERQTRLDDTVSEESRMQAELEALNDEEGGARENLESARERVRSLQESGGSREAELEAARNELAARIRAAEDIEKTIGHIDGVKEDEEAEAEATTEGDDEGGGEGDGGDASESGDAGEDGGGDHEHEGA